MTGFRDGSGISWTMCKQSALCSKQITILTPHHSILQAGCSSWCSNNSVKALKAINISHTHTQPFNDLLSGTTRVGWYQKKHSPTHTHPDHRTSFIFFLHLQRSMASSLFSLRAWQSSWTTSLQVFLLALDPQLHNPCISSPNYHHLFAAHAHTNAACFAAIPMLCHLYLVSLSTPINISLKN